MTKKNKFSALEESNSSAATEGFPQKISAGEQQLFIGTNQRDRFVFDDPQDSSQVWIVGFNPERNGDILDITAFLPKDISLDTLDAYITVEAYRGGTLLKIPSDDGQTNKEIWLIGTNISSAEELKGLVSDGNLVISDHYNWSPENGDDGYYDAGSGEDTVTVELTGAYDHLVITPDENGNILIQFADGPTLTLDNTEEIVINGTDADDVIIIRGDFTNTDLAYSTVTIFGGAGNDVIDASAYDSGHRVQAYGGDGDDQIFGGAGDDSLFGNNDNDILWGGLGNDYLDGGSGDDSLNGDVFAFSRPVGELNDTLKGGAGADTLAGHWGNDDLDGGTGNDILNGGADDDVLVGGSGNDDLDGGAGVDTVDYSSYLTSSADQVFINLAAGEALEVDNGSVYSDTLENVENVIGSAGNDFIDGDNQANRLDGSDGSDRLSGGGNDDVIIGGLGNDRLIGGSGNDDLQGGSGNDTADYSDYLTSATDSVSVDLTQNVATESGVQGTYTDRLTNIENVTGSAGDDFILGNSASNIIEGNTGNDILSGGLGNDSLDGGVGIDTIDYSRYLKNQSNQILIDLTVGEAIESTSIGNFTDNFSNIENVIGAAGNDFIGGDNNANRLDGYTGNDFITAGAGDDVLIGGLGDDTLEGGDGDDYIIGDEVSFTAPSVGVSVNDSLRGGAGNDTLVGLWGDDELYGGSDDDSLNGGADDDLLVGGEGNDDLDGGTGQDTVSYDYLGSGRHLVLSLDYGTSKVFWDSVRFRPSSIDTDTLTAIENVIGSGGNDSITGNSENNVLDGGSGFDVLAGGDGDDTYIVDSQLDKIFEYTNGGTDVVWAYDHYQLSDYVENLTLLGNDSLNGSGNRLNNTITGNASQNILFGGAGDDTLIGGLGDDTLEGGSGQDTVDYSSYLTNANDGVLVNLETGSVSEVSTDAGGAFQDTLVDIENVIGSSGNDFFLGNDGSNLFNGLGGNDVFIGSIGFDLYAGGEGYDALRLNGNYLDYSISGDDTFATIQGIDSSYTLLSIEAIEFSDGQVPVYYLNGTQNSLPPVLTNKTLLVDENTAPGFLGTVPAFDPDGDAFTFAITGGFGANKFSINADTGVVSSLVPLDHESFSFYNLEITATDTDGLYGKSTLSINVLDVNEAPITENDKTIALSFDSGTVDMSIASPVDPDGDELTIRILNLPVNGEVKLADGTALFTGTIISTADLTALTFTADPSKMGLGVFSYQVDDGNGGRTTSQVNIDVLTPVSDKLHLTGSSGNDILFDSKYSDVMTGLAGADTFVFNNIDGKENVITDFNLGEGDRLDLSSLFSGLSGAQIQSRIALNFINSNTLVDIDLNMDQSVDMSILLQGVDLTKGSLDPVINGSDFGSVREDFTFIDAGRDESNTLGRTGYLTFSDNDPFNAHQITSIVSSAGALGTLTATVNQDTTLTAEDGSIRWQYRVLNDDVQFLSSGQTITESFTLTLADSDGGEATTKLGILITGSNDQPTISAADSSVLITESTAPAHPVRELTDHGSILFTDVDSSDNHRVSNITSSIGALGVLTANVSDVRKDGVSGGTVSWTYAVQNTDIEFLAEGETITESFEITIADDHGRDTTQTIEATITGTNDAPFVFDGDTNGAVKVVPVNNPGLTLETGGYIDFFDFDASDTHTLSVVSLDTHGDFTAVLSEGSAGANSSGRVEWEYSIDAFTLQTLVADGKDRIENFEITIDDGHGGTTTQTVEVLINSGEKIYTSNSFSVGFNALDQSIWNAGMQDNTYWDDFLGLEFDYWKNGKIFDFAGAKLTTGARFDFRTGLESEIDFGLGSVDAYVPFDINIDTVYDTGLQTLNFDTSAIVSSGGGFTTSLTNGFFDANLILDLDYIFRVDFEPPWDDESSNVFRITDENFFDLDYSVGLAELEDFIDSYSGGVFDLTYGDFPTLTTDSAIAGDLNGFDYRSHNEGDNFIQLNLDLDELIARIASFGALGSPFDYDLDLGIIDGSLDILDLDLLAGASLAQDFGLSVDSLTGKIHFTETVGGFNRDIDFTFGDSISLDISDLASYDANGDGNIDYEIIMNPLVNFTNNTDIDLNAGFEVNLFDIDVGYDIGFSDGRYNPGPLATLGGDLTLTTLDAYDKTFDLSFNEVTSTQFSFSIEGLNLVPEARDAYFSIAENQSPQSLGSIIAYDPEGEPLSYVIDSGNDDGLFQVNANTGEVLTTQALNYNAAKLHELKIIVTDDQGDTDLVTVRVNVENVNEAPSIEPPSAFAIDENLAAHVIGTITATDSDINDVLSYSIVAGNVAGLFEIDTSTGGISTTGPLDFETENQYVLTVEVADADGLTDEAQVTINVTDQSEGPVVTDFSTSVNENTGITALGSVAENAADSDVAYSITDGNSAGLFSIDANTGVISTTGELDHEREPEHVLTVSGTDSIGVSDSATVTVTVNDINEAPSNQVGYVSYFETVGLAFDENLPGGQFVRDYDLHDPEGGAVSYEIVVDDSGLFAIDANGRVTTTGGLDYEHGNYDVTIRASDPTGLSTDKTFSFAAKNVLTSDLLAAVDENTGITALGSVAENAADSDVVYAITEGNSAGLFSIDTNTGVISTTGELDHEREPEHILTVSGTDSEGVSDNATVTVTVNDINEAPNVSLTTIQNSIAEDADTTSRILVATATVTDDALGSNVLSLVGEDANLFELDGNNIYLKAGASLDFETNPALDFAVYVDDASIPGNPDGSFNFRVNVTDVPEGPSSLTAYDGIYYYHTDSHSLQNGAPALINPLDGTEMIPAVLVEGGASNYVVTGSTNGTGSFAVNTSPEYDFEVTAGFESNGESGSFSYAADDGGVPATGTVIVQAYTDAIGKIWHGGDGNDVLIGSTANDQLFGGAGNDILFGGGGRDLFYSGAGDDFIYIGDANSALIDGGTGNDTIVGGAGNNPFLFDYGTDLGEDIVYGGAGGLDSARVRTSTDSLHYIYISAVSVNNYQIKDSDVLTNWSQEDLDAARTQTIQDVDYFSINHHSSEELNVKFTGNFSGLTTSTDISVSNVGDGVINFDGGGITSFSTSTRILDSSGNDTVIGGAGKDWFIVENGGEDVFFGNGGTDNLANRAGSKVTADGGTGIDSVVHTTQSTSLDTITITGDGSGTFTIDDNNGIISSYTSFERLTVTEPTSDELTGLDVIITGDFSASLSSTNQYAITINSANSTAGKLNLDASGVISVDTYIAGNGGMFVDTLIGGAGNDYLRGYGGDDIIDGGLGNDYLTGGDGSDAINGGGGNDLIEEGGAGVNILTGGDGSDEFSFYFESGFFDPLQSGFDVNQITDYDSLVEGDLLNLGDMYGEIEGLGYTVDSVVNNGGDLTVNYSDSVTSYNTVVVDLGLYTGDVEFYDDTLTILIATGVV